jgi:phosphoglycerate-specific signal transduction histidine kinase
MSFSALITIIFLSSLISCIILFASKGAASYVASSVSSEIMSRINSGEAAACLGINSIRELKNDNIYTKVWIDRIIKNSLLDKIDPLKTIPDKVLVQIEIDNVVVFSNDKNISKEVSYFYSDTQVEEPINDIVYNNRIGTLNVRVNPKVIIPIVGSILIIIIALAILALLVQQIMNRFLIIPILNPINQLEKKVKAIAEEDRETALNTHLVLKKPLMEIESLADSTNSIMNKLHSYNELLENQKQVLENQNAELEVQNDELVKSKLQIEDQQAQLIQSEKMASVGLLTAAITHEINTPVGAINSNAQLSDMLLTGLKDNAVI